MFRDKASQPIEFADHFFAETASPVRIELGSATHTGKVRTSNEDHFLVSRRTRVQEVLETNLPEGTLPLIADEDFQIFVADGMGGPAFGEVASRMAIEIVWGLVAEASSWVTKLTNPDALEIPKRLDAYMQRIEQRMAEIGRSDDRLLEAGTTLVAAHLTGWEAMVCNIGDSRAYLIRGESCEQITHDHTLGRELGQEGRDSNAFGSLRHILTNCLLMDGDHRADPELHHIKLAAGDRLLLCTDGLSNMISDADIAAVIAANPEPQAACDLLIEGALAAGGRDNITVVVAALEEESLEPSPES